MVSGDGGSHSSLSITNSSPGASSTTSSLNSWKWTGLWAFATSITEADVASSKAAALAAGSTIGTVSKQLFPFSYTWEAAVDPFDVNVPSEEIAFNDALERLKEVEAAGGAISSIPFGTLGDASKPAAEGVAMAPAIPLDLSKTKSISNVAEGVAKPTNAPSSASSKKSAASGTASLPAVSTFADNGFTDASTRFPDKCPTGGRWTGCFDTAVPIALGRRSSLAQNLTVNTIPVAESFCLFLNATAPENSAIHFLTQQDQGSISTDVLNKLPEGHIHARGSGENTYGKFELIGSLDLATGILQLRRLYVQTPESIAERAAARRSPRSGRGRRAVRLLAGDAPRGVRKRQLSWKRRSMIQDEPTDLGESRKRQRKRSSSTGSAVAMEMMPSVQDTTIAPADVAFMTQLPRDGTSGEPVTNTDSTMPQSTLLNPQWPMPPLNIPVQENIKRGGTSGSSGGATPMSTPKSNPAATSVPVLTLPLAGDPLKARWRAAQFLYYYKPAPDDSSIVNAGGSGNAGIKSVVYEGELFMGQRHGRGVCLYDNDMIYEGEWQYDKEHGYGTLLSSDRKSIMYEGEWDRGKIHGKGKYYYGDEKDEKQDNLKKKTPSSSAAPTSPGPANSGVSVRSKHRYDGEFRENLRHGTGIYVLPDGSVYEGLWRDGTMNGRGLFRWPDGSCYDGEWKDGKRNGQGLLTASDGFTYDGTWVLNCMEGRGSATYPSGQQYHGIFSNGKREGRGTIIFSNGAVYEGRFRDDAVDGQGTMKIRRAVVVPRQDADENEKADFMIPVSFQSDIGHIHRKAGFTVGGH